MCKPCGATISGKKTTNLKQHQQTSHPDLRAKTHTDDIINLDDDNQVGSSDVQPSFLEVKVACPLCNQLFTGEDIYIHASVCGESHISGDTVKEKTEDTEDTNENFMSSSDILKSLARKVDTSQTLNISVTREDLFHRGLKQWARQKQASPKNLLRVSFIGEHGIDQDALRKEFITEMIRGIERHFFEGDGQQSKNPKYSICDYQENKFKICGEIFATSLVQEGPAPNFLTKWCYHLLCHGEMKKDIMSSEVTDMEMKSLIKEVEHADKERMMELSDPIVACGYTGPINFDRKKAIIDAITLHAVVRLIPILIQLREGLKFYGLDKALAHHHQMFEELFVPGHLKDVDADFLMFALSPDFSEEGSIRRQQEMRVINFLQGFLQKLEDEEGDTHTEGSPEIPAAVIPGGKRPSVRSFLQWVTGQAHIPLIESERQSFKITVNFEHDWESCYGSHSICYPIVNACAVAITFPTCHMTSYNEFEINLTEAIWAGYEFSRH